MGVKDKIVSKGGKMCIEMTPKIQKETLAGSYKDVLFHFQRTKKGV